MTNFFDALADLKSQAHNMERPTPKVAADIAKELLRLVAADEHIPSHLIIELYAHHWGAPPVRRPKTTWQWVRSACDKNHTRCHEVFVTDTHILATNGHRIHRARVTDTNKRTPGRYSYGGDYVGPLDSVRELVSGIQAYFPPGDAGPDVSIGEFVRESGNAQYREVGGQWFNAQYIDQARMVPGAWLVRAFEGRGHANGVTCLRLISNEGYKGFEAVVMPCKLPELAN